MKRFLLILMALILVAVVSCNPDANVNGGGSGGAKIALDKEAGKEALIEQGSKPSGGSKAIDHTGFVIKTGWIYTENGNEEKIFITLGGKDNFYWIGFNDEDGLELSAHTEYFYFYDSDSAKYYYDEDSGWIDITSLASPSLSLRAMMGSLADAFIYSAYIHDGHLTKGASYAVLGRPCTKYSWAGSYYGVTLSMDFYVDDEYGVTLKQEFHGESPEEVVGFNFEMLDGTKFSGVEVSDLPAGRPADIDPTD